ncbi:metal-sulfur cluster biosynthetic enzyme [Halobacteriales archaeon SW_7_68_16]|nr:MAG: metal-sulfur cluster biosynthetic enzyme [Halobacteriales archaeon SW_7_68_16]
MSSERDPDPDADEFSTACSYNKYERGEAIEGVPATGEDAEGVAADVWAELRAIQDPEMPISIVDLGLLYGVTVEDGRATVDMTLTYTGCPARELLTGTVEARVASVEGIESVDLRLVWSPGWSVDMVTEAGKEDLREFGVSV